MQYRWIALGAICLGVGCQGPFIAKPRGWDQAAIQYHTEYNRLEQKAISRAASIQPAMNKQSAIAGEADRLHKLIAASFIIGEEREVMQDLYQQQYDLMLEVMEVATQNQAELVQIVGESVDFRLLVERRLEEVTDQFAEAWVQPGK